MGVAKKVILAMMIGPALFVWALLTPKYPPVAQAAHEKSAVIWIGRINQAETAYFSQFDKYAITLTRLRQLDLIARSIEDGKASGYLFTVAARPKGYTITAVPEVPGQTGRRSFYSDETLVIRANDTIAVPATAASPELK
jgi:type IV pilus assembly protein PilA